MTDFNDYLADAFGDTITPDSYVERLLDGRVIRVDAHEFEYSFQWAYVDFGDHEDAVPQVTIHQYRQATALSRGPRYVALLFPFSPLNPVKSGFQWAGKTVRSALAWANENQAALAATVEDCNLILNSDAIYEGSLDDLKPRWRYENGAIVPAPPVS